MTALLEMRHVIHRYNGRTVLDIPSFAVQAGSITGLAGPNGSGKTTMLKLLSFIEPCASGRIAFRGQPSAPFHENIRYRISLLLQTPYLLKRSVFDNIAYGLKLRDTTDHLPQKVEAALGLVGLPASFGRRQWHELSGGESQRVALAARLALKPDCLLLDEPTASADLQSAELIRQAILVARKEWNAAVIVSSHQHQWLQTFCDRILDLHRGRILPCPLQNLLTGPWHRGDNDNFTKILADSQIIILSSPPSPESSAVLPPAAITLLAGEAAARPSDNILRGKIVSASVREDNDDQISLHALCGDQKFTVELSQDAWQTMGLQPGQSVRIAFSSDDIVWLPN